VDAGVNIKTYGIITDYITMVRHGYT